MVDGIPLPVRPGLVHYLVNKPVGVVSTALDTHGRPTVVGLVPEEPRVFPVGRLDQDSEGLIILTNDGDLTQRITHPSQGVTKTYQVLVNGPAAGHHLRSLEAGVELEDGPARAVSARLVESHQGRAQIEVVMAEGRKREVRRMLAAVGLTVERLFRSAIGPITDSTLKAGEWRNLTVEEVRLLYGRDL